MRRFAIVMIVGLSCATAPAQISRVGSTLEGTIKDSSGAPLPGIEIQLRNLETNQSRAVLSDDEGFFRATELPVGTYHVRVEQPGFAIYQHSGVVLLIGQTVQLEISLVPAGVGTQITVTDQPPPIEFSQTTLTTTIELEKILEFPVINRNYLNFVLLAAGVASSNSRSGRQTPLSDSGFTFGGLRSRSNNVSIDGLDNNDEFTGSSRTELSVETIREFQVVNNGLSAESGGAAGGSINVISRTGTNIYHGEIFFFGRNRALDGPEPLEKISLPQPALRKLRGGYGFGGPLVKDRTFFFSAFEQEHMRAKENPDVDPQLATEINRFLSRGSLPRLSSRHIVQSAYPVAQAETEFSMKINHQANVRHSLMARYAFTNNRLAGDAFNTGSLVDVSARGSSFIEDHALAMSLASTIGLRSVNDLRFQISTRRVTLRTNDEVGPGIEIAGLISFGRPWEGNGRRREDHYQVSDTLASDRGRHLLKSGFTINHVRLRADLQDGFGGLFTFRTLQDFFVARPEAFRQTFGRSDTKPHVTLVGLFVQDHWKASKRLTLDYGLRYDFEKLPDRFHSDLNNISPRVGIAYSPSTKTVMRAGYGIFYDRYVLAFLNRALQKNGSDAFEQIADASLAAQIFRLTSGGAPISPGDAIRPSIYRADPKMATSLSQQANLGAEYLLSSNLTAGVNYFFVRGRKLARTRNINLLPTAILTLENARALGVPDPAPQQIGREIFLPARRETSLNDIFQIENAASSTYHGLSVTLNRRFIDELAFAANYTFSKTIDDASDFDEQPEHPFRLRSERALSRNHQGHRFVFSALFELLEEEEARSTQKDERLWREILEDLEFAPIVTITDGRPFNPLAGFDANRNHALPLSARPLGFGRNTIRSPRFAAVDLRVIKYFRICDRCRLDFVVETFNLLNRTNISEPNQFFGPELRPLPGFGQAVKAFNPRQFQFSIDLEF